jgi:hypothetical protein
MTVSIVDIRQVKTAHRGRWFDAAPTCEFRKSLPRTAYRGPGGTYFVTGEINGAGKRRYTIRCQRHCGGIVTVGEWMEYRTRSGASRAAKRLASGTAR